MMAKGLTCRNRNLTSISPLLSSQVMERHISYSLSQTDACSSLYSDLWVTIIAVKKVNDDLFGWEVALNSDCFAWLHDAESFMKLREAFFVRLFIASTLRRFLFFCKESYGFFKCPLFLFDIPRLIVYCAQISHIAGYKLIQVHIFIPSDCQSTEFQFMKWIYSV